jgi:hypothetical protein
MLYPGDNWNRPGSVGKHQRVSEQLYVISVLTDLVMLWLNDSYKAIFLMRKQTSQGERFRLKS